MKGRKRIMKQNVARFLCLLLVVALLLSASCLAENRTITVMAQDRNNTSRTWWNIENYHDWAAGKIFDAKLEELGITLDIEAIAKDQFKTAALTRQQAWLNMPDLIRAAGTETDWVGYGKAGKIWNIRELLEEYDEDGSIWAYMQKLGGSSFATILDADVWGHTQDHGDCGQAQPQKCQFFIVARVVQQQ